MRVSLCKHTFPVQPPHGSLAHPGDCTRCGLTHDEYEQQLAEQEARRRLATAARGRCDRCKLPDRMLFTFTPTARPWNPDPASHRLCTPCWSAATEADERGDHLTFDEVLEHGEEELARFLGRRA